MGYLSILIFTDILAKKTHFFTGPPLVLASLTIINVEYCQKYLKKLIVALGFIVALLVLMNKRSKLHVRLCSKI
jgi:hypothetical protein